jgi:RNA polymerase sigma-70 factor (ECF subfamily)
VDTPTDVLLWQEAVDGETAAFGVLFERHVRAVYNACFRRTGDWSVAEDVTAVVFLEAWRRRADVRFVGESVLPWLYGVAANVLRNRWRSTRRHRAALLRLPPPEAEGPIDDDVAGRLDDERRMRDVLALVALLSRRDREVLEACAWSGLSYEEAAVALCVPVGTVRSRLARARKRLREAEQHAASGHPVPERTTVEETKP